MRNFYLTIVTENHNQNTLAEIFAELLKNDLGKDWKIEKINKYNKFENSYKIELTSQFKEESPGEIFHLAISLTDQLVSPWLVYFDKDDNSIELIYNKSEHSRFTNNEYCAIKWGHFQIV